MKKNNIALALTALATATLMGCGDDSADVSFDTATFNPRNLHYSYPLDNQQHVAPRTIVALQFSHEVTAETSNFVFSGPEGGVPFTLESVADGRGVVLTPDDALNPATDYKVVMDGVTVLGETVSFSDGALNFTTRAALEGPISTQKSAADFKVDSLFPDDQQFESMDFTTFRLRTSHPIDESTAMYGDTISLTRDGELVPAQLLVGRTAISVDPKEDMSPGATYELSVNGLKSVFGDDIEAYTHTTVPQDTTSPTTGERAVLVTNAPPADPSLGCQDEGVRVSELTGQPINCVPLNSTLLQDRTVSKQKGDMYAELAFTPNFPEVTPLRVKKGGILKGDSLEVLIGGAVPVGFDSGDVTVHIISDASGYLFPNPNAESDDAPKKLRLFMDVAFATEDPRANGAFTQKLLHLELVGAGLIEDGQLIADAITIVEPRVLGVDSAYGVLSFRMESYQDQEIARQKPIDTVNPFVPAMDGGNGLELSWQPGNVANRMEPGDPIIIHFNEVLEEATIKSPADADAEGVSPSLMLTKGGMPEPFSWKLDGSALIITPDTPVEYGVEYVITTTPEITDLEGNALQMLDSLEGDNSLDFTLPEYVSVDFNAPQQLDNGPVDVRRSPFVTTTYPGFPCASTSATQAEINAGFQGVCISSSPKDEQVEIDKLPITLIPANRNIRVRFSQNMNAETIVLGDTFLVEKEKEGEWKAVSGQLEVASRSLAFRPESAWEEGALYRYVLLSNGGGTGCLGICSVDGLPLQTALLMGDGLKSGGPHMEILFRGSSPSSTVFQELANLPSVDVNNNLQIDSKEIAITSAEIGPSDLLDNATLVLPHEGGGGGIITKANTGCGFKALGQGGAIRCDSKKVMYVSGALNSEILNYDPEREGIPVVIYPTMVALTNLDSVAIIGLPLDTDELGGTLSNIPVIGGILGGVVKTLGDVLGVLGLDLSDTILGESISLLPVESSTGPNIMRVRYNQDADGLRTVPPIGYIFETEDGPMFRITFDLLFDAPGLVVLNGAGGHDVKSKPIDAVTLEGPLDFLPDGRLFLKMKNKEEKYISLNISLAGLEGGKIKLKIPPGGISLSYQSSSIK